MSPMGLKLLPCAWWVIFCCAGWSSLGNFSYNHIRNS
jgi:hypothetical protein